MAIPALAALLLLLVPGCRGRRPDARTPGADALPRPVQCLGRLVPGEKVLALAAQSDPVVKEIRVRRNERVKKGQILAVFQQFDCADAAVRQAEADWHLAQVQLDRASGAENLAAIAAQEAVVQRALREHEKASADMGRAREFIRGGQISVSDLETAEVTLKRAESALQEGEKRLVSLKASRPMEIALAERRLASARAALDRARADADLHLLRAPMDGVVIDIHAWPGELAGPRGVLDLGDTDHMMVEAEVYINDLKHVRPGAQALVQGDGFTGEFTGRVTEIVGQIDSNILYSSDPYSYSDRRVVKVRIRPDQAAGLSAMSNAQVRVTIRP
jgi:HlyD family secretion protein